jgi:hypothetical protein
MPVRVVERSLVGVTQDLMSNQMESDGMRVEEKDLIRVLKICKDPGRFLGSIRVLVGMIQELKAYYQSGRFH